MTDGHGPRWREDDEPWYRQFWPWFLIILPGTVVVAALGTVYIASRHADDLVVDDYYKDGLAINRQLEKQRTASELGISAAVSVLERRLQVRLSNDEFSDRLELRLSHPLEADRDFVVDLARLAPAMYGAELPSAVEPNWHWILTDPAGRWRLDGSLSDADFVGGYAP